MGMVCPADLDTLTGFWDLFVWCALGLTMHSIFRLIYKSTKKADYAAVGAISMFMPNELLYHIFTFMMMMTGCYANWRVYTCEDWDSNAVGHSLFFFWTLALGLTHLGWITYDMTVFGAISFFFAFLLSICNIIFAWPHDFYTVIIHFILAGLCFVLAVVHVYLYSNRKDYAAEVAKSNEYYLEKKGRVNKSAVRAAETVEYETGAEGGDVESVSETAPAAYTGKPSGSAIRQRTPANAAGDGELFSVFHGN